MSSFLLNQNQTRRGKWTKEEEVYAACLMEAFNEGSLEDVDEGMSLRGYLAKKLRTNVKRISKKYEGTNYNGKRIYMKNAGPNKNIVAARQAQIKQLEFRFEQSVKQMDDAETTKKTMSSSNTQAASSGSLMTPFTADFPRLPHGRQAPAPAFPASSLASANLLSSTVLEDNRRILAQQMALNSFGIERYATGWGSVTGPSTNIGSFGSVDASRRLHALMDSIASTQTPSHLALRTITVPLSGSNTALDRLLRQRQETREAEALHLLIAANSATATARADKPHSSPSGSMVVASKRSPQPLPLSAVSNKRAKLM